MPRAKGLVHRVRHGEWCYHDLNTLCDEVMDLRQQKREDEAKIEELANALSNALDEVKFLDGCRKSLESLTPGGSEFYRDPERCVSTVRERFKSGHETKKELAKLRKARR